MKSYDTQEICKYITQFTSDKHSVKLYFGQQKTNDKQTFYENNSNHMVSQSQNKQKTFDMMILSLITR